MPASEEDATAVRIARFHIPNPVLVAFFECVLGEQSIRERRNAVSCLLEIVDLLNPPPLINEGVYLQAKAAVEEGGNSLFTLEFQALASKNWRTALALEGKIMVWMGEKEDRHRIRWYVGWLLNMITLEMERERTAGCYPD